MIEQHPAFLRLARAIGRYQWARHWFGLSRQAPGQAETGLILIQIDGLARRQFERAIVKRKMPYLRRLIRKRGYEVHTHYSGVPSTTPAVQAELFYGVKSAVPSFDFVDSQSGEYCRMFDSEPAMRMEEELKQQGEPLLLNGSAYSNIYSGGAESANFCASHMGWNNMIRSVSPIRVAAGLVLHLFVVVRMILLALLEVVLATYDLVRGYLSGHTFWEELLFIPIRAGVSILLREFSTLGAQIDVSRGVPIVEVNFLGYDEQSHRRGPGSYYAHWTLKGIDTAIKRIHSAAKASPQRQYALWVYSDHGQESVTPYERHTGKPIREAVLDVFQNVGREGPAVHRKDRRKPSTRASWLRSRHVTPAEIDPEQSQRKDVPLLTAKGPIAHLYFPESQDSGMIDKIARAFVDEAQVPMIFAREGSSAATVWTRDGKYRLPEDAEAVFGASHPILEEVRHDTVAMVQNRFSGDLILSGWNPERPLTFADENGSHGGPGRAEIQGFALLPNGVTGDAASKGYLRPSDIYQLALAARPKALTQDQDARQDPEVVRDVLPEAS